MKRFIQSIFLVPFIFAVSCAQDHFHENYKTENVIIIVTDGPRYSETWGNPNYDYIPFQASMKSEGVLFTNFYNHGTTTTIPGHTAITTGNYEPINNGGLEAPQYPSIFQYWRKKYAKKQNRTWIIASKDKLDVLSNCASLGWKDKYMPSSNCGVDGMGVGSGYREDSATLVKSIEVLQMHHPNLVLINFRDPDLSAHQGIWGGYLNGIIQTDKLVYEIWQFVQNDPHYKDKTALFITNDHGRHLNDVQDGFISHGDDCSGCRKISLLAIGPDFKKGKVVNAVHSQIDIPVTVGEIMGFSATNAKGEILSGLLK